MLRIISSMQSNWTCRVLLAALVVFCANPTVAAAPPVQEKQDAKESPAAFRAYLPTIRLKALRDNERKAVAALEAWLGMSNLWVNGGLINLLQQSQIEEEYHRSRLRALRLDSDYRDSLDQLTGRHRVSAEQRRQMEKAATLPMTKHFQRFEECTRDSKRTFFELAKIEAAKDVNKVRPGTINILTESALVKNTKLPKRFLKSWDVWKKIDDRKELMERIMKNRDDLGELRKREYELWEKQKNLSETDLQRRENLRFETSLAELQYTLLEYEKQPWNEIEDVAARLRRRKDFLFGVDRAIRTLLDDACLERLNRLNQSWPRLAPVKVKDLDLVVGEEGKAEGTVTSLLKTPDAQLTGKKKLRHLRTLAESYPIQKRLFYISFFHVEQIKSTQNSPPSPPPDLELDKKVVDILKGLRNGSDDHPYAPEPLLKREADFRQARKQLLQTWIDYQMLRLDLYAALGVAPPER